MSDFLTQFAPALPEIFVLAMVSLILVIDAAVDDSKRYIAYVLSLATLAGAAFLTLRDFSTMPVLALGGLFFVGLHAGQFGYVHLLCELVEVEHRVFLAVLAVESGFRTQPHVLYIEGSITSITALDALPIFVQRFFAIHDLGSPLKCYYI